MNFQKTFIDCHGKTAVFELSPGLWDQNANEMRALEPNAVIAGSSICERLQSCSHSVFYCEIHNFGHIAIFPSVGGQP
ncbi:hypothetical protein NCCP691_40870 [Noviherbaspirillum aridicola]|uniref:Uncharacterized protein n=1 Tax=Noviherbaspirillum aridicola TaxID=2849687 RepID=A0ABQ4QA92_9BURK|nr:hypothetical protein NCCP691_40870 [Noviherbaspirillum aridicola]